MANKNFTDLKSLFAYAQKQVKDVMMNEMTEKAKDIEQEKIKEVVYDAYTPLDDNKPWKRRGEDGGLMDRDNMHRRYYENGNDQSIEIINLTDGNPHPTYTTFTEAPDYLTGIIEYGRNRGMYMYDREGGYGYRMPRPFVSESIKEMQKTLAHIKVMKEGLRKRGFTIE